MFLTDILLSGAIYGILGITSVFLWSQTVLFEPKDSLIVFDEDTSKILAMIGLGNLTICLVKIDTISSDDTKLILSLAVIYILITVYMGYNVCGNEEYDCWYPLNV